MLPEPAVFPLVSVKTKLTLAGELFGLAIASPAFNEVAADHYAGIVTTRRRAGRPIEAFDALIAATALASGAKDDSGAANPASVFSCAGEKIPDARFQVR